MSLRQVQECIDRVTAEHVPRTAEDLADLATGTAASAAAQLSELARSSQQLANSAAQADEPTEATPDAQSLIQRCTQLVSACQNGKLHASGSGWESPAWQECKIFAHLCAPNRRHKPCQVRLRLPNTRHNRFQDPVLPLFCRYAAFTMLAGDVSTETAHSQGANEWAGKAVKQVDLALMSGCPYQLAEPFLAHALHRQSQHRQAKRGELMSTTSVHCRFCRYQCH